MIIYIYGSDDFKNEIKELLNHSNIKFRLDENGEIIELNSLDDLKNAIEDNPSNIYLIDDSKIIKKNSFNKKINFLKPKDGIEEEYLLDNGIGDLSVDSLDELSKHIIKKLEAQSIHNEANEIQNSIIEIVEDAYEKNDSDLNDTFQLDDELSSLLSQRDEENSVAIEEIDDLSSYFEEKPNKSQKNEDNLVSSNELSDLQDLSFEEDFGNINEVNTEYGQGVEMSNEFSEFDSLNEADLMAALEGIDDTIVSAPLPKKKVSSSVSSSTSSVNLGTTSSDEIANLISSLLNNKTLEITIKVKD